jgi:hypothetical protein
MSGKNAVPRIGRSDVGVRTKQTDQQRIAELARRLAERD